MVTIEELRARATVTLEIQDEDIRPEDQFCLDEPDLDKQLIAEIHDRLERGDTWAWCYVKVTVAVEDPLLGKVTSLQTLGGCSYANERDFRLDCYYLDMVNTALVEIKAQLDAVVVTAVGEAFTLADQQELARLLYKRMGKDAGAALRAWRTLNCNSTTLEKFGELLGHTVVS